MKEFCRMVMVGLLIALCIIPAFFGLIALVVGGIALTVAYVIFFIAVWLDQEVSWSRT